MTKDKIIDEYVKGKLPFSGLYRKASKGEKCPDGLSARILAEAARQRRLGLVNGQVQRLWRRMRSRIEQHRIWVGTVLPIAAAALLVFALSMTRDDPETLPECRGAPTAVERGAGQTIPTPAPGLWLDQIRQLRQQGRVEEADAALAAFRQRYPEYPLDALRAAPD